MKFADFRIVTKTASRIALTMAIVAIGGCAHRSKDVPAGSMPLSANPESQVRFGADPGPMASDPGSVNVFGEMKGVRVGRVHAVGDSNFQQHTFTDQGYDSDVAIDPSGKWMVFGSTRDSDRSNLYMQRVDGTAVIQLTAEAADDAYPTFSPDGKLIAFSSTRAGNWQIFTMDLAGRNVTQVSTGPMQAIHPSWSPDGTRLVYCSLGGKSNQWELWTTNLVTNEKRMIGYGLFPTWSPSRDSDRIAFQRPRQRGSRWFGLWTLDLVNGEATRATEVVVSSNAAILSPTWSPDGNRLAFATVMDPDHNLKPKPQGRTDVWVVNADGTERQRLTDGTGVNLMPCWNGERVFFISDRGGTECIWSTRVDSAKSLRLADGKKDIAPTKEEPPVRQAMTPMDVTTPREAPRPPQSADTRDPSEPQ
jgi:TolB protein